MNQYLNNEYSENYINIANRISFMSLTVSINLSSANPTKWSNTLKQFVGNSPKLRPRFYDKSMQNIREDLSQML